MRWTTSLARWLHLPARRRWLLVEAAFYLLIARLMLKLVPFQHLTRLFERPATRPAVTGPLRGEVTREVRWAILTATRHLSAHIVCFPRAITAQTMLRRRGVATTLYYGAAKEPAQRLITHVWVQDGDEGVIGTRTTRGYTVLACYPQQSAATVPPAPQSHSPH